MKQHRLTYSHMNRIRALLWVALLSTAIAGHAPAPWAATDQKPSDTTKPTATITDTTAPTDAPNEHQPDLAFTMKADSRRPPEEAQKQLSILVARLMQDDRLVLRMTVFAPVMASNSYAIGLATKVWNTLRKHLSDMGVPRQRILRSGLQPGRSATTADERSEVEIRLVVME